jgi:hypothetical protein
MVKWEELVMSDIKLVDVTIHIDEKTDENTRKKIDAALRALHGVVSVHMPMDKPHLLVVEYNPEVTTSTHMLTMVRELAGHAEMIGL